MNNFVDKFLDKMKLGSNYDEEDDGYDSYDEDDEDDIYAEDSKPVRNRQKSSFVSVSDEDSSSEYSAKDSDDQSFKSSASRTQHRQKPASRSYSRSSQKVVSMQERMSSMEVCVIKPVTVDDGREIVDTLLNGRAVILNLEGLDVEMAQRIIDFTSGACFAIQGNLQRVSNYIFVVTPVSIEISGDIQELLSESFSINAGNSSSSDTSF